MTISASDVMKLREATGLGMMICKKALTEAGGDMNRAIDDLRKQGEMTAAKRAGKSAKEGKVCIVVQGTDALIYEVNSETDFVARNSDFLSFAEHLGTLLLEKKPADMPQALAMPSPLFGDISVEAKLLEMVGKIGEKITFRRFSLLSVNPSVEHAFSYIHGQGKIGVLVIVGADKKEALDAADFHELGKDLAMQIAAAKPLSVNRDGVPQAIVAKEKEIYQSQVQMSGKPEKIWDKIVEGKLNKFYTQVCLLDQEYIKETDISVTGRIGQFEKKHGAAITVRSFVRFELGMEE